MAERLLMTLDRPEAEVMLEVEVLEINTSDVKDLGINYPEKVGIGFQTTKEQGNNIPLDGFNRSNMFINLGEGNGISVDIKKIRSKAKVLANPRIRVKNAKKALIDIGERIPVLTSTLNNDTTIQKVDYQDVGLKLEVTPEISLDGEISMDVDFTLSNLGLGEKSSTGDIYYRTNNRTAKTILSSRDGETQMLAGLISQNSNESKNGLPGLSDIPLIGGLFSSSSTDNKSTEVILLITPRVERNIDLPGSHVNTIPVGTDEMPGEQNTILRSAGHVRLNDDNFSAPPLAPPAHFPTAQGALPSPNFEQDTVGKPL
jgi:general secretion pathway protein D